MSTPVVTDKWAGNFDCDSCRRKRLMADEFSKKALDKYRKEGGRLKCKKCVADAEEAERTAAAAKRAAANDESSSTETRTCSTCKTSLGADAFNRNQWAKGDGKSRCRSCVETAIAEEESQQKLFKETALAAAKANVEQAKASGNAQALLKAESEVAALEAEKVTGLKPVKMSQGGRGRGRSTSVRGRGRGAAR